MGTWSQSMWAHTFKKDKNHSQNHLGQNNLIKAHTPNLKDY
jgi:hypothetical protein